jgi:oligogalacturonide transport system permease protein
MQNALPANAAGKPVKRQRLHSGKWTGMFFILPWLIGFTLFQLYPFLASLFYSFTNYSLLDRPVFTGLTNFIRLFTIDPLFLNSLKVTGAYTLIAVPLKLAFALMVAMILNIKLRSIDMYRTMYYMPSILGGSVAISVLWRVMFMREGMINRLIGLVGLGPVDWLGNPNIALYTISVLQIWQFGSPMVIFLAALKQIPTELYEAARVDGAGRVRQFFKITVPMISPVIFFNLIMQSIQALQNFTSAFVVTNGGPMKSTYLIGMKLYEDAFKNYKMGYASAESWVLFILIMALTLIVFKSSDSWVYYEDGGDKR